MLNFFYKKPEQFILKTYSIEEENINKTKQQLRPILSSLSIVGLITSFLFIPPLLNWLHLSSPIYYFLVFFNAILSFSFFKVLCELHVERFKKQTMTNIAYLFSPHYRHQIKTLKTLKRKILTIMENEQHAFSLLFYIENNIKNTHPHMMPQGLESGIIDDYTFNNNLNYTQIDIDTNDDTYIHSERIFTQIKTFMKNKKFSEAFPLIAQLSMDIHQIDCFNEGLDRDAYFEEKYEDFKNDVMEQAKFLNE